MPSGARCEVCRKACGSSDVLAGVRCEWCGVQVGGSSAGGLGAGGAPFHLSLSASRPFWAGVPMVWKRVGDPCGRGVVLAARVPRRGR